MSFTSLQSIASFAYGRRKIPIYGPVIQVDVLINFAIMMIKYDDANNYSEIYEMKKLPTMS